MTTDEREPAEIALQRELGRSGAAAKTPIARGAEKPNPAAMQREPRLMTGLSVS